MFSKSGFDFRGFSALFINVPIDMFSNYFWSASPQFNQQEYPRPAVQIYRLLSLDSHDKINLSINRSSIYPFTRPWNYDWFLNNDCNNCESNKLSFNHRQMPDDLKQNFLKLVKNERLRLVAELVTWFYEAIRIIILLFGLFKFISTKQNAESQIRWNRGPIK